MKTKQMAVTFLALFALTALTLAGTPAARAADGLSLPPGGGLTIGTQLPLQFPDIRLVTPSPAPSGLAAPALSATADSPTSVRLRWKAVDKATGYQVWRGGRSLGFSTLIYEGASPSYTDTGLTPGGTYRYWARAVRSSLRGVIYGAISKEVGVKLFDTSFVPKFYVGALDEAVFAIWYMNNLPEASGWELQRSEGTSWPFMPVYQGTDMKFTDTDQTDSRVHLYRVRAYQVIGTKVYVSAFSEILAGIGLAQTGQITFEAAGDAGGRLSWSAVAWADGYRVIKFVNQDVDTDMDEHLDVYDGTELTCDAGPLLPGNVYTFYVYATKNVWQGVFQGPESRLSVAFPPLEAPTLSAAAFGSAGANLSWNAVPGAEEYQVQRGTDSGMAFAQEVWRGPETAIADTGLTAGATCWYRVRALLAAPNGTVYGPFSAAVPVTPQ